VAPVYDSHAPSARSTDPPDFTLDPVGTLRGLLVYIVQYDNTTDEVNGVTAGGTAMTRVRFLAGSAGTEQGAVYVYFLGASIPADDPITIALDIVALPTADKSVLAIGYTAGANCEVEAHDVLNVDPTTAPSITLVTGAGVETAVSAAIHSGVTAVANIVAGTGYTLRTGGAQWDSGGDTGAVETKDTNPTGGNVVVDFSQQNEEAHMVAVAIKEAVAGGQTVAINPATETDAAQALGRVKVHTASPALETDAAQALGSQKSRTLVPALETDLAVALARSKVRLLGVALETDQALAITRVVAIVVAINPALETDEARPVGRTKARTLIPALETDVAVALGRVSSRLLGVALEIDEAMSFTVVTIATWRSVGTVEGSSVSAPSGEIITSPSGRIILVPPGGLVEGVEGPPITPP
jgi:hypothetical protein